MYLTQYEFLEENKLTKQATSFIIKIMNDVFFRILKQMHIYRVLLIKEWNILRNKRFYIMKKWALTVALVVILALSGCANNVKSGLESLEVGDYEGAKGAFENEIKKGKNLDEAYRGLGIACFELEEYEEAASAFELAVENETKELATLFGMMGACYMEIGEYEKALDVYTKALGMENITAELEQEIQYNLIAVYENMADWDAAKKQMESYQKAYPDDERVEKESDFLETR